jgi:Tfp pilus assembly protein PilF
MKQFFQYILYFSITLILSCSPKQGAEKYNLLPMFGEIKKSDEQLKIDADFIAECDKYFKGRNEATKYHIDKGWEYFYQNKLDTAMMRFNQAWLLDSLNADVYWGFGNILGNQQKYQESLRYFDKSLSLNSKNTQVWYCSAISYGQLFFQTKDIKMLNKAIDNLKQSVALDPTNALAYGQLTTCYSYFNQQDSVRKYLEITDRIDPNAIHPEVRELLQR